MSSITRTCDCGRVFYENSEYQDWNNGEFEALQNDSNATALNCSVGSVIFDGVEYVMHCDCYHEKANIFIRRIDSHVRQISEYINGEKQRFMEAADNYPSIR